jgi:multidrug efflux pump subunit AcrA (membrane-fusion protein)
MKKAIQGTAAVAAALMILIFASGCEQLRSRFGGGSGGAPVGAAAMPPIPVFAVNTTVAARGPIQDYLALSGDIVAGSTVDTYSDVAGKVSRIFVSIGSYINRGDPIAEVDPSRPGMTYIPGIARAPISGTIVALPAQVGMTVSQAVPLARIAGGNSSRGLEIRLYVAERFISKMALALPCEITLDAYPGETFRGSISEVSPVVDPASRTMEVRVNVDNPGSRLKAGMFAKVRVITERHDNIVKVPAAAMIQRFGEDYLFIAEQDPANAGFVARRRSVTPGILVDGVLEIQQGLLPDEEVIIRGHTFLEDGARVNIVDRMAPVGASY